MDWILETLEAFGHRPAVIGPSSSFSFAAVGERLLEVERQLRAMEPPVGPVGVRTDNFADDLVVLFALARLGRTALPLPTALPAVEAERLRQAVGVRCILGGDARALKPNLCPPVEASPPALLGSLRGAAGLILFSSGTTGAPKGMLHNFEALLDRYRGLQRHRHRTLQLLLVDHIGGLDSAFRCLFSGSTLVVPESLRPEAVGRAIEREAVTLLPASPSFLNLLLLADVPRRFDCASLQIIAYGAEPMPATLLRRLAAAFPKVALQQKFGTSETGAIRIRSRGSDSRFFTIDDPSTDWKVVDGELWLRSPSRILGYLDAEPGGLEAEGWFRTGDLVEEDGSGGLRIAGRREAHINVGGQKVRPGEVEDILLDLPGILSCDVYGRPDPILGGVVACDLVVSEPGSEAEWKRRVRAHCRPRMAGWKIPATIRLKQGPTLSRRLKRLKGTSENPL